METNIRPLPELLQVFLDNQDLFDTGLCRWTTLLRSKDLISLQEDVLIDRMLSAEINWYPFTYMWEKGKIEPRIDWLKENLK